VWWLYALAYPPPDAAHSLTAYGLGSTVWWPSASGLFQVLMGMGEKGCGGQDPGKARTLRAASRRMALCFRPILSQVLWEEGGRGGG